MEFEKQIKNTTFHFSFKKYSFRFHVLFHNIKKNHFYIPFFINFGYGPIEEEFSNRKHIFFYFDILGEYKPSYQSKLHISIPIK
jgi:hypothetical protein